MLFLSKPFIKGYLKKIPGEVYYSNCVLRICPTISGEWPQSRKRFGGECSRILTGHAILTLPLLRVRKVSALMLHFVTDTLFGDKT